jgi:hypothetical protein
MNLPSWIEPRLGPKPKTEEEMSRDVQRVVDAIIAKRRNKMERVRAKFSVSNILKDQYGNVVVKLYAVYKGDESSPENESFSNSTPSGNAELTITNPAASEFFEKLAGKYVYLDFTAAS